LRADVEAKRIDGAMGGFRRHLTYANVVATLSLFLVLGGGTALASYVISSNSQVGPDTISGHKPPTGYHANIVGGSVNGQDVGNNSLTGADIADRSGVDTCQAPLTAKFGPICAGSDGAARTWNQALDYCRGFGLRLPSFSEGLALAAGYDVPGVNQDQSFWTDETLYTHQLDAWAMGERDPYTFIADITGTVQTVCVTDPSA
jgi:hypothetical protein